MQNGIGKSVDYTMSHITGKIRILGKDPGGQVIFQYVQAKDPARIGKIFTGDFADQKWLPADIGAELSEDE